MKITWLGHATFLLEGAKRTLIDPFITENPMSSIEVKDIDVDVIVVTHGHGDHLGDAIEISKNCDAPVVCIHELSRYLARKDVEAIGMNIGGTGEVKGVRITIVPAIHSADIEEDSLISAGSAVGVIVEDKIRVYHAGDTDVFLDMQLIRELHKPQLMLLPIGDWYTMGIRGAVKALELVRPEIAIPMHYNTFPVIKQDPEDFKKAVKEKGLRVKVVILKPGESYFLESSKYKSYQKS